MLKQSLALGLIIAALVMSACGGASSSARPPADCHCDAPRHLDRHGRHPPPHRPLPPN